MEIRCGILTISDKGSKGERVDESGQVIRGLMNSIGGKVTAYEIIPDEITIISQKLREWSDGGLVDLILTNGGTGLGERDVTPEATLAVLDKTLPGFGEIMRTETFKIKPVSILSRAIAGSRKKCVIINLPGNPRAVKECLVVILPALPHAVEMISGTVTEHAIKKEPEE